MAEEEKDAHKHWLVGAVEKLGIPTVYLLVLSFACWRIGVYVSTKVVTPIVDSHIEALNAHIEVARTLVQTVDEARINARESLLKIEKNSDEMVRNTDEILRTLKDKQ